MVLSDQRLVELKDKVYCPRDYAIETDFSADPNQFDRLKILVSLVINTFYIHGVVQEPPSPSKSGYLFINDVFYNDRRHPESQDYSRFYILLLFIVYCCCLLFIVVVYCLLLCCSVIIDWSNDDKRQKESPRLNQFISLDMSSVSFTDLSLRLGYPYLYCHHGNCEHIMIFNDIR